MVFCMSLMPVLKDVVPGKVIQTTPTNILKQLILDPDITQMDVLILAPEDLPHFDRKELRHKLKYKHPDICVIFIQTIKDDIKLKYATYSMTVRKYTRDAIEDVFITCVNEHKLLTGKHLVSSDDFKEIKT